MTSLTTRQRDILKILLEVNQPVGTGEIANSVKLSARQVNYSMKGIGHWLKSRDARVEAFPVDAVGRKLQFGARKGVTRTVLNWFWAHVEHNLKSE